MEEEKQKGKSKIIVNIENIHCVGLRNGEPETFRK